jgi:acetyl-CoA carboxylase carboxyltransferase component
MNANAMGATAVYAWPTAQVAVMGALASALAMSPEGRRGHSNIPL